MARRRKNRSVGLLTAVFVEMGTLLGIVGLAQPTWTTRVMEGVDHVVATAPAAVDDALEHSQAVWNRGLVSTAPPSADLNATPHATWPPAAQPGHAVDLQPSWSDAPSRVAQKNSYVPTTPMTPLTQIYPPAAYGGGVSFPQPRY